MNSTPAWGEPQATTVGQLRPGDFVIEVLVQGYRAQAINSGIAAISEPAYGAWTLNTQAAPRRRIQRTPLLSRTLAFHDRSLGEVTVPADAPVQARPLLRPEGEASLEDQVAALTADHEQACAETAADMGQDLVDNGGWYELANAVLDLAGPEISAEARREFARRLGLPRGNDEGAI